MKNGLVIGKFMPLHLGHISLINFARSFCDSLTIALCYTDKEPIPGTLRKEWLCAVFGDDNKITVLPIHYDESVLPNTSVSSKAVSALWAAHLTDVLPQKPQLLFSSEDYGNYLAGFMGATHIPFDIKREIVGVSGTQARQSPFTYWDYLPEQVRPYFVKKIAITGSESTGKSELTRRLAAYFETAFVPEMARAIIEHTEFCTRDHLKQIAVLHARAILNKTKEANKLLFADTELHTTKSYSRFLFNEELTVEDWIENANHFDLYLFLETDCPFVQDGTRLANEERIKLSQSHKQQLKDSGVNFISISGNWDNRFNEACKIIRNTFLHG